jgi:hypothetical protein
MIIALVQFALPQPMTVAQARDMFNSTAPRYLGLPGLVRKRYVLSEDGRTAGGLYFWQTRADAERQYNADWRRFVTEKYGTEPQLSYFESPVFVDNLKGVIGQDD